MKKNFLLLFALFFAVVAYSQRDDRQPRVRRHEMNPEAIATAQTNKLHEVLNLDSMQYSMVMLMNYADAMALQDSMKARAARNNGERVRPSEEERRARAEIMKQRRALRDEQMKKILTPEQYEKYTEYMKSVSRSGRPMGRSHRGRAPRGSME